VPFVLDASLVLAWSFDDEPEPASAFSFELLARDQAIVRSIWSVEIANALMVAERVGRVTRSDVTRLVSMAREFRLEVELTMTQLALAPVLDVARDYGLTAYDASYLELAMRRGLPLASLDRRLRAAAESAGVLLVA
jgi:predicted nucleic acid-binding protein